jgi:hypothetical protein
MRDRRAHHDLCFGCGLANVFGLHLELERAAGAGGGVAGRFFVKHPAPVGTFVEIVADARRAEATGERGPVASAEVLTD